MNSIKAKMKKSKCLEKKHLSIIIDNETLDNIVSYHCPEDSEIEGLIPTFLDCLETEEERDIVWKRAIPSSGQKAILPVLMCPDDCDLWCTVVVVEVESVGSHIIWHRFGIDSSSSKDFSPEKIGSKVKWISGLGPFTFDKEKYRNCLKLFN